MANTSTTTTTKSFGDRTFVGIGNLIRLLPTGTVFMYQFLSPLLTNYGQCNTMNKYLTGALLAVCGFSCCFSCFTDSYTGSDGKVYYGLATKNGLWSFSDPNASAMNLSACKLQLGDFVHAFFSLAVFGVMGLMDPNTVDCYYPSLESNQKVLLMSVPAGVGALSSTVFSVFPNRRHGIGYPATQTSDTSN